MSRKQKRAQTSKVSKDDDDDVDVPYARPPENPKRNAKTLYELAAERQATLASGTDTVDSLLTKDNVVNVAIGPDGEIRPLDGSTLPVQSTSEDVSPRLDTLLLAVSLSALHFTLEALTVHQYAEQLIWKHVFWHTVLQAFPVLCLLIHFMHGNLVSIHMSKQVADAISGLKQLLFVAVANVSGCYLIYLTNDEGYMAVMKNAPSIGTIWVWSVIELGLVGALAGVAGPGAYAWYNGYGIL